MWLSKTLMLKEQAAQADVGTHDLHDEDHGTQTEKFQADVVIQDSVGEKHVHRLTLILW
jgi:hypothetical protein